MKNLPSKIGARIKEVRKAKGLTQERLAELVEISPRYLSRLEVGQQSASLETLARVAEVLDIELCEFFDFGHHAAPQVVRRTLQKLVREADDEKLRLALKVFRAVL